MALVILADKDPSFASKCGALLSREPAVEVEAVPSVSRAKELAIERDAYVVAFGPGLPADQALAAAEELADRRPPVAVILVAQHVTTELLRLGMRAGLKDVVSAEDQTFSDVCNALKDGLEAARRWRESTEGGGAGTEQTPRKAKVVTVFSTKGGVGKTVIASNLGVALAGDLKKDTVLVDLDLQFGDAGIMLQLEPRRTIYDAAQSSDRLDAEMLEGFLATHSSGLKVLLAPVRPEDAEAVTTARISKIIGLLSGMADYIVIDTPGSFDDTVLAAIDKSDEVYAIATMDVASIKNTKISLQKLRQLGYQNGLVRLVLNRADSRVLLEAGDVEKAIEGGRIVARIPSDRLVPRSVNRGVPVVVDSPRSAVARSIIELAKVVTAETGEAK